MPPKKQRISRVSFQNTFMGGKKVHSPLLTLIFQGSSDETHHFSVVVSKKVDKTAVGRNTLRRRIYSILTKVPFKKPYIVICITKKGIETKDFKELQAMLTSATTPFI